MPIWDVIIALLARGAYRSDAAPDPLQDVLGADPRFVAAAFSGWILAENATPGQRAAIRQRQRDEAELFRLMPRVEPRREEPPGPSPWEAIGERILEDLSGSWPGRRARPSRRRAPSCTSCSRDARRGAQPAAVSAVEVVRRRSTSLRSR
jgi:hypothetical protein